MARITGRTRALTAAVILTAAALSISACSSSGDTGTGSTDGAGQTLKLWHYEGADSAMGKAWAEAIDVFEKETGAKVEFEEKSFEQIQKTASRCSTRMPRPTSWSSTRATRPPASSRRRD